MLKKISNSLKNIFIRLFKIDDTPQRIALGFGLGVFLGILPGTGPAASLLLAVIFKVNRASALIGSLLTNTWLSFVTFVLAVKVGSGMLGVNWQETYQQVTYNLKNLHLASLFTVSMLKVMLPLVIGYIIISFCLGIAAYLATLTVIIKYRKIKNG